MSFASSHGLRPTSRRLLRLLQTLSLSGVALGAGCASPGAPPAEADIFTPAAGHNFRAPVGEVTLRAITTRTVCFTTDGTAPELRGDVCEGATTARLDERNTIRLECGDETGPMVYRGVRLAYDWPGADGELVRTASANYILDCTRPAADSDGDGVPNAEDNCPSVANRDQADANGNMIGDACEVMGAPDADRDGRPDTADNCPRVWNVNQADDDRDGLGNVCDTTPRGDASPCHGPTAPSPAPSPRGRTRCSAASTAAATPAAPATGGGLRARRHHRVERLAQRPPRGSAVHLHQLRQHRDVSPCTTTCATRAGPTPWRRG
jgi:hypothetical protein